MIEIRGRDQGFKLETKEEANVRQKETKIKYNHTFPEKNLETHVHMYPGKIF